MEAGSYIPDTKDFVGIEAKITLFLPGFLDTQEIWKTLAQIL
jgi:hypothetical protein